MLLAWLPALAHDLAGDPTVRSLLATPPFHRAAALVSVIWLALGACFAGLAWLLTRGVGSPELAPAVALGGSALALAGREPVQHALGSGAVAGELLALGLVVCATVVAGLLVHGLSWALGGPRRSLVGFVAAILGLAGVAVQLWRSLGEGIGSSWPLVFGVPLLAALVLLARVRRRSPPGRGLSAVAAGGVVAPIALLIAAGGPPRLPAPDRRPPGDALNVVVMMVDTLRADHTALGGYPLDTTPRLAAAVADGPATAFRGATATASFTRPAVNSLFTSRLPDPARLDPEPDAWTMARAFRAAGYETGAFSTNHLIGDAFAAGFRSFRSTSGLRFLQRSFLIGKLIVGKEKLGIFRIADGTAIYKIPGDRLTLAALRWIDRLDGRPFFAYLHLGDPHWPYGNHDYGLVPAPLRSLEDPISLVELLRRRERTRANREERASARLRELVGRYDEEIRHADRALGELLAGVRARGLEGRTLVIVVGDHGEEFFEHGGLGHGHDIDEFLVNVPLVFLWPTDPRFADLPRRVDRPVSLLDVLPTLTDYCALPPPPGPVLGRSLRPLLEGKEGARTGPVIAESLKGDVIAGSYREGALKVRVVYPNAARRLEEGRAELYDLDRDPAEERPLEPVGEHAALVARARLLLEQLWAERREGEPAKEEALPAEPDQKLIEQLRALGYVD